MDSNFVDSAEGFDVDWKSTEPSSLIQAPKSIKTEKPEQKKIFIAPKGTIATSSKPIARGSATSSAASSESAESYTYGKKRDKGFVIHEEESSSDSENSD